MKQPARCSLQVSRSDFAMATIGPELWIPDFWSITGSPIAPGFGVERRDIRREV